MRALKPSFAYDEQDRVVSVAMSAIETDPRARRAARLARRARLKAEAQGRALDEATSGQEFAQSPAVSPMTTVTSSTRMILSVTLLL